MVLREYTIIFPIQLGQQNPTLKLIEDVCKHLINSSFYFLLLWCNTGPLVVNILLEFTLVCQSIELLVDRIRLCCLNVRNFNIIAKVFSEFTCSMNLLKLPATSNINTACQSSIFALVICLMDRKMLIKSKAMNMGNLI